MTDETGKCATCGGLSHTQGGKCPLVKAYEYYPDGKLKRIEFMTPADYPVTHKVGDVSTTMWSEPPHLGDVKANN